MASCEIKDICGKHGDQRACQVCTINARFPEVSLFQQDEIGHCQTPTGIMTFCRVQSWCNPEATNDTNTQLSTTAMAKMAIPAEALTDSVMGNQGRTVKAWRSQSLSLHEQ
jgi:hypothetical protein